MTKDQMAEYDLFLDENDWDIYYWATQDEPSSASSSTSSSDSSYGSASEVQSSTNTQESTSSTGGVPLSGEHGVPKSYAGEWAQTVGTFKPAYRPVPARWRDSGVLTALREHVRSRSGEKGGMAFMPALRS